MRYNNYHKHDDHSSIFGMPDSATSQKEYVERCVELGHTSYFTTNHGSFGDIFEAKTLCDEYGLKCVAGIEGYIVKNPLEKDKSNYHIVIIPKTDVARKKMNKVSSRANIEGFYYKPRIFIDDLLALDKNDIFITTACEGGILKDSDSIENIFFPLFKHFGENVLLEVQNHNTESQIAINRKCLDLSNKYGLRLICANDSHYIDEKGMRQRAELLKGKRINYGNEDSYILDFPNYETMFDRFKKQGVLTDKQIEEGIRNTLLFDECEEIKIDKSIKMPNIYPDLTPKQRVEKLKQLINNKFKAIRQKENLTKEELQERLDGIREEMQVIEDTNEEIHTADYFLFNERNTDIAVNEFGGVLTRGGRGSCGSFYINKVLGITQIDRFNAPIKMYSSRFMSTARLLENRALPDIDYNVASQEPFYMASRKLLGQNGCYPMIAYGTMGLSESFRNTCRSKGMEFDEFNEVGKNIEEYTNDKKWGKIIDEAKQNVGIIVSASVHPCAFILSDKDLLEEYGVVRVGENLCVMITSSEADEYKVLKNDYLIVSVWELISDTFKLLNKPIIDAYELMKEIKDDDRIWKLYEDGITCTLNQVDSDYGRQLCQKYKPKDMAETSMLTAISRPFFDAWRDRFLTREEFDSGCKQMNELLASTKGYLCYQENLMQYFEWLGQPPSVSIGLIKKISKKKIKQEDFDKLEKSIKQKWVENTGSEDMFEENWKMVQGCMNYGFCSSHAFSTALDMAYGAYLKVNYPLEYYSVCFNKYIDDERRTRILTEELNYFGIQLKDMKFRYSKGEYFFDKKTNSIYKGIGSVKFLNTQIGEELYALKDNNYNSFVDLLLDIKAKTSLNSRQLDILIKIGFFSEFGSIKKLVSIVEIFNKWYEKKSISKSKIEELGLGEIDLSQFATDISEKTGKVTNTYKNLDWLKLVNHITAKIPDAEYKIGELIKIQSEILGYINYVNSDIDRRYVVVTNLDTKYSPKFDAYCINNGKTQEMKIHKTKKYNDKSVKTSFKDTPIKNGDIIYMKSCKKEQAQKKADDMWVVVEGKFNWWINDYIKVNL